MSGMWWDAIAGAGAEQVEGYAVRAQTRNENRISTVNANASNRVRRAANAFSAARGSLARYMQSLNNKEALTQAGQAQAVNLRNGLRAADKLRERGVLGSVGEVEQRGRAVASQGASGMGGSVVDNVNAATALRAAMIAGAVKDQASTVNYEVTLKAQNIASQMTRSLDSSIILDSIDYNENVPWIKYIYSNTQNAFRGMAKAMGQGAQLYTDQGSKSPQQTQYRPEYDGVAVRQRSNNIYDLGDYAYDNKVGFGESGDKRTTFEVYGGGMYDITYGKTDKIKFNADTGDSAGWL